MNLPRSHGPAALARLIRGSRPAAIGAVIASTALVTAACSSGSQPAARNTTITAGAGQSLPGAAGSTNSAGDTAGGGATAMPGMSMGAAAPSGKAAAPVSGDTVAIKNFAFSPAKLVVKVGTTVTWTNEDGDAHTVTSSGSKGPLDSAAFNKGETFSYTFTSVGSFAYFCEIHPFMTATVTVTK